MGFSGYSEAFKSPVPAFPRTEVSLEKLIAAREKLRELDVAGYRTSQGSGNSAWARRVGRPRFASAEGLGQSFAPLY